MHMKNIIKSCIAFAAIVLVAVSCNVDAIGTKLTPGDATAASFLQTVVNDQAISASATTYEITIGRTAANGSATVNLTSNLPAGMCPSTATFDAGSYETTIPLNISSVNVGTIVKGSIAIDGQDSFARSTVSVTLAKAYDWSSIGKGEFLDNFWEGFLAEVEILKADGYDVYRVLKPYAEETASSATGKGPDYIALLMQEQFKAVGIKAELTGVEDADATYRVTGEYDIALYCMIADQAGDPYYCINALFRQSSDWARGGFKNDQCEKLIDQLAAETDVNKRAELANKIVQMVIDDNAYGFVGLFNKTTVAAPGVVNIGENSPFDYYAVSPVTDKQ